MSLKELTLEKHKQAESTAFMKAVFNKTLPKEAWLDFTYQKALFYSALEAAAGACNLLDDMPDLRRAYYLYRDYIDLNTDGYRPAYRQVVIDYHSYLLSISDDPAKVMAHIYTWHMGDLYGGQMIKNIVPGQHAAFTFADRDGLIAAIRSKLDDSMADEANTAFDWAIRILNEYNV